MDVQARYNEVKKFNEIAGNLSNVDVGTIEAQLKVVLEEVEELEDAFNDENATELLDGACDAFVTLMGLLQQMEEAGFKVDEALKRVNENNLTKFPKTVSEEEIAYYNSVMDYDVRYNAEHNCYVLKDLNEKVRKPEGFVSVELDDLLPHNFFGSMFVEEQE